MSLAWKRSSGTKSASGVICAFPCFYYGFTAKPAGSDRTLVLYDNPSAASGNEVEDFTVDGTKKTDGHSHSKPVFCVNGLYLSISGGTAVVYFSPRNG